MLALRDLWAGLLFLVLGLLLLIILIPIGIDEPNKIQFAALSPSYYPRFVAIAMTLIGVAVTARTLFGQANEVRIIRPEPWEVLKVGLAFLVFFVTVLALPSLGFVLGGALALLALMLTAGERKPLVLVLVPLLLPLILYVFFTKLANIPIPGGVLESYLMRI